MSATCFPLLLHPGSLTHFPSTNIASDGRRSDVSAAGDLVRTRLVWCGVVWLFLSFVEESELELHMVLI